MTAAYVYIAHSMWTLMFFERAKGIYRRQSSAYTIRILIKLIKNLFVVMLIRKPSLGLHQCSIYIDIFVYNLFEAPRLIIFGSEKVKSYYKDSRARTAAPLYTTGLPQFIIKPSKRHINTWILAVNLMRTFEMYIYVKFSVNLNKNCN